MPANEDVPAEVLEARRKLREKMGQGAQIGGKGSMRRKSKPVPKAAHNDERKVHEIARKAGLQQIGAMEEANIIFNDGNVTQIVNPRVWGLLQANAFVVHGTPAETNISKLSPELRGDVAPGGGGFGGPAGLPPAFTSAAMKLKTALDAAGLKDSDIADPAKAEQLNNVVAGLSLTPEESQALAMLMQFNPSGAAGGEEGAAEGDDEDVPALEGDKNFEEVAADAD